MAIADVLHRAGHDAAAARGAAREALEHYEQKGHLVGAERARRALAE